MLDLSHGEVVSLAVEGRHIEVPVIVEPGVADRVASLTLGFGRSKAGAIGNGIGANAYALRTTANSWVIPHLTIE